MNEAGLKTIPEIINAAKSSNLGILALLILALAVVGFYFFRNSGVHYRLAVFVLMLAGAAVFGYATLVAQREDAIHAREDAIHAQVTILPELKLNLAFPGDNAANPHRAQVKAYVTPKTEPDSAIDAAQHLRTDVQAVPGPGGMYLVFSKLSVGDTVYVEVSDQNKKWQSYAMRMLEANLQMLPEE
jgi:hypothetical protein